MQDLTSDRMGAEADLNRTLGTFRYLQGLKAARQRNTAVLQAEAGGSSSSAAPAEGMLKNYSI